MVKIRIEIAFAIFMINRFAKNSSSEYFNIINQILQYLAGSPDKSIMFGGDKELKVIGYSNSD